MLSTFLITHLIATTATGTGNIGEYIIERARNQGQTTTSFHSSPQPSISRKQEDDDLKKRIKEAEERRLAIANEAAQEPDPLTDEMRIAEEKAKRNTQIREQQLKLFELEQTARQKRAAALEKDKMDEALANQLMKNGTPESKARARGIRNAIIERQKREMELRKQEHQLQLIAAEQEYETTQQLLDEEEHDMARDLDQEQKILARKFENAQQEIEHHTQMLGGAIDTTKRHLETAQVREEIERKKMELQASFIQEYKTHLLPKMLGMIDQLRDSLEAALEGKLDRETTDRTRQIINTATLGMNEVATDAIINIEVPETRMTPQIQERYQQRSAARERGGAQAAKGFNQTP